MTQSVPAFLLTHAAVKQRELLRNAGRNKQIPHADAAGHLQISLPVQASVGHVINDVPEGRNILLLPGIYPDRKQVIARLQKICEFCPE